MAMAAMMGVGLCSCEKEDIKPIPGQEGSGGGDNPGGATVEWVDLGLPSGLQWAKCNMGATTPEGYGKYYAWGETSPKEAYEWDTYRYCAADEDGNLLSLTKYNTVESMGTVDNRTTLQSGDDVATAVYGAGVRIPTKLDWQELMDHTSSTWTTENGVYGKKFTAANGNSLFLPAAGSYWRSYLTNEAVNGDYWSASLVEDGPDHVWSFDFNSGSAYMGSCYRYCGLSVRPVRSAR